LRPLVDALDADPRLGAACPKILFAGRFAAVEVRTDTDRRGFGDGRDLGVFVSGARVDGDDVWGRVQFVDGTWGLEPGTDDGGQWTGPVAHLQVPVPSDPVPMPIEAPTAVVSLLLSADGARTVALGAGGDVTEHEVGPTPEWCDVVQAGPTATIVNNVGTDLLADGFAADRGYLAPDDGRYDTPTDVAAWCGAGVLLRRAYLDDVGGFDEGLFVYYEDVELSLRGAARGWRYRYVPEAVVHHVHAASTRRGSALKQYYDERNRLLVLARHGSVKTTATASVRSLLVTASYARRDVLAPMLHRRAPQPDIVWRRLRSFGAYARGIPHAVRERRASV
jgi:hypothetical protein